MISPTLAPAALASPERGVPALATPHGKVESTAGEISGSRIWHLYVLRCGDGSLYTGITPDVEARLDVHRAGKGARYTRSRGPLHLIHQESVGSKPDALRREIMFKRLSKAAKLHFIHASRI